MLALPLSKEPRGIRIPLPGDHWWPGRAKSATEAMAKAEGRRPPGWRMLTQKVTALGIETSEDSVRRCVLGEVTWELALPISIVLKIPPPVTVFETEAQAVLMTDDNIQKALAQLRSLVPGIDSQDQMRKVEPEDEPSGTKGRGKGRKPR